MATYLDKIIQSKVSIVEMQKTQDSLSEMKLKASNLPPCREFIGAIQNRKQEGLISVIAEIKKASPSKGVIRPNFHPEEIAIQYEKKNATCLSVLTDEEFFQGSLDYLINIRSKVKLPLLRKDFIVDEYQIYQSKVYGAEEINGQDIL